MKRIIRMVILLCLPAMMVFPVKAEEAPSQIERAVVSFAAAIGYAKFDAARDKSVKDVFIRADHIMYKNKKEMKAERGS